MTTPEPLVSVIIPVFNGERWISESVESARLQTHQNLEILVVDDGSTDRTVELVETLIERDRRVRLIRQQNGGVSRARNRGIAEVAGEFIATLDADDLWQPAKIELQLARMLAGGERMGLVYCWWVWIDSEGRVLDPSPAWRVEGDALAKLVQVNYIGNASTPLFRRTALTESGGYEESLRGGCEDWDLALRVAARYQVGVVPSVLVGYRRSEGSMSLNAASMQSAHKTVLERVRSRQPELPHRLFQRSEDQFALYMASRMFWSGSAGKAVQWALRCRRWSLAMQVLPYVLRACTKAAFSKGRPGALVMKPGVALDTAGIGEPLIPYDRFY